MGVPQDEQLCRNWSSGQQGTVLVGYTVINLHIMNQKAHSVEVLGGFLAKTVFAFIPCFFAVYSLFVYIDSSPKLLYWVSIPGMYTWTVYLVFGQLACQTTFYVFLGTKMIRKGFRLSYSHLSRFSPEQNRKSVGLIG